MPHKHKFEEILEKLKKWAEHSGNEELDNHIKELKDAISVSFTAQDEEEGEEGGEGGNNPEPPDVP